MVVEAQSGVDVLVRKVMLKYKLPNETMYRFVDRPIHGIAVIVPIEEQSERSVKPDVNPLVVQQTLNPTALEFRPDKSNI